MEIVKDIVVWISLIVGLVLISLILVAAGKWIYRKLKKKDDDVDDGNDDMDIITTVSILASSL